MSKSETSDPVANTLEPLADLTVERAWAMLESAPDGMLLVDELGAVLAVNAQIEALFGYDRAELLGRSVDVLLPEHLHDAHRAHRTRYREAPTVRPMGIERELRARRRDGSEFPVEVSLSPLHDSGGRAVVATVRDVTERRAVERRLELSERTFRASFENAPVGMVLSRLSAEGARVIERVNRAFAEMLGAEPNALVGLDFSALTHPDDNAADEVAASEMGGGDRDHYATEKRYRRSDGSYVWTLLHATVVDRTDGAVALAHVVDITDRRARQSEQERLNTMKDRERIGRDLHDLVIQRLFGAGMKLQAVVPHIESEVASQQALATIDEVDVAIRELRSTIFELSSKPEAPADSIQQTLDDAAASLGFMPDLILRGSRSRLDGVLLDQLVPTLREALSNVARHAGARAVTVELAVGADTVTLTVDDDGRGPPDAIVRGHGLDNLARRAEILGGTCELTKRPEGGARLAWSVPLSF